MPASCQGKFSGTEAERQRILLNAAKNDFAYVDVGLSTPKLENFVSEVKTVGAKSIVSFHDFYQSLSLPELNDILEREIACGADVCKIVTTAKQIEDNLTLLKFTATACKKQATKIELATAKITAVQQIGTGARVCVDTCDLMAPGEGILVGCQSAGFFLVEAEVHENPYVQPRPFRVNAGPASQYTLTSPQHTRYLSELKAGDEVLIVNRKGNVKQTNVGRAKIEMRPLLLIEAEVQGTKIKTILQNAETIHIVTPDGSKPVTELKAGDEVLAHIAAKGGRHFGVAVPDETVIER